MANTTAKQANLKVTTLLKVAWTKFTAAMYANPLLAITGALALVTTGVIGLASWFEKSAERAMQAATKSKEAWDSTKAEIDQLNSSLQNTKSRIDELNAKKNLSLIESEELAELNKANDELERELRIKQALAETQGKEANDDALKYFNKKTNTVEYSTQGGRLHVSDPTRLPLIDSVEKTLKQIPQLKKDLEDWQAQLEQIEISDPNFTKNSQWLKIKGNINVAEQSLSRYKEFVDETITDFMELDGSLIEGMDDGILSRLQSLYATYDEVINGAAQAHTNTISAILDKADYSGTKNTLLQMGKNGSLSADLLSSQFPQLIAFLEEAGISAQELYQYIMNLVDPDAFKYEELKRQLQETMGIDTKNPSQEQATKDNWLQESGLYDDKALEVYASIKAKYTNGETEFWTDKDWKKNILEGLEAEIEAEEAQTPEIEITPTISSSVQQIATQLEPQFSKLAQAYQAVFQLDDNGKEIFSPDNIDNSMLEGLRQAFLGVEETLGSAFDETQLEHFFTLLTSEGSSAEDVKQAFNQLASSYLYSTDTLAQLNEETASAVEKQLKELGVANARELVADALAQKDIEQAAAKEYLAVTSRDLADATLSEIAAFVQENVSSEESGQALARLYLQKALLNTSTISTSADVENILTLAKAAGLSSDVLGGLLAAKAKFDTAMATGNGIEDAQAAFNAEKARLQEMLQNFTPVKFERNLPKHTGAASSAGSAAADAYLEAFEKELSQYKDLRDRGKLTEKEYLDHLRSLYRHYFRDKKEYLDEYQKYEDEYLQGMKSLYEKALSSATGLLDRQIDAYNKQKDAAVSSLEAERDARKESLEAQKEALQEQMDAIDKQIEGKDAVIESINEEIDAIRQANEERKRQIDLQQKKYDLERAQNQRGILAYSESTGMAYVNDTAAQRDARQSLDDALVDEQVAGKEKQIRLIEKEVSLLEDKKDLLADQQEALDQQIENLDLYYDKLIEDTNRYWDSLTQNLQDYKARWEELGKIQEQAEADVLLRQLGISPQDILSGSEQALQTFKDGYLGVLSQIYQGNDQMSASLAQAVQSLDSLAGEGLLSQLETAKGAVSDVAHAIGGSAGPSDGSTALSGQDSGDGDAGAPSLTGALEGLKGVADTTLGTEGTEGEGMLGQFGKLQESVGQVSNAIGSSQDSDKPLGETNTGSTGQQESLTGALSSLQEEARDILGEPGGEGLIGKFEQMNVPLAEAEEHVRGILEGLSEMGQKDLEFSVQVTGGRGNASPTVGRTSGRKVLKAFAEGSRGLPKAEKDALRSEYGQAELTVYPDGMAELTTRPVISDLPKGTVIYDGQQTQEILEGNPDGRRALPAGQALRPLQEGDRAFALQKALAPLLHRADENPAYLTGSLTASYGREMETMAGRLTAAQAVTRNVQPTIHQQITINCPNVTNQSGIEYIQRELGHLSQLALQEAMKH